MRKLKLKNIKCFVQSDCLNLFSVAMAKCLRLCDILKKEVYLAHKGWKLKVKRSGSYIRSVTGEDLVTTASQRQAHLWGSQRTEWGPTCSLPLALTTTDPQTPALIPPRTATNSLITWHQVPRRGRATSRHRARGTELPTREPWGQLKPCPNHTRDTNSRWPLSHSTSSRFLGTASRPRKWEDWQ